jgi:anti-sigma28 factor (negative regulator of flagellin synthesis)
MNKVVLMSVSLAIGIGLGTFIDRNLLSTPKASLEASADGSSPSAPIQATLADSGAAVTLDVEPIRAMLREELNAALARSQAAPGSAQTQQLSVSAPASTLSVQQQHDTLQAVEGLVSGGHWGDEERNDFHQKLAQLDPQQREQAMQQLVQAINNGSLKVSTNGPPL